MGPVGKDFGSIFGSSGGDFGGPAAITGKGFVLERSQQSAESCTLPAQPLVFEASNRGQRPRFFFSVVAAAAASCTLPAIPASADRSEGGRVGGIKVDYMYPTASGQPRHRAGIDGLIALIGSLVDGFIG